MYKKLYTLYFLLLITTSLLAMPRLPVADTLKTLRGTAQIAATVYLAAQYRDYADKAAQQRFDTALRRQAKQSNDAFFATVAQGVAVYSYYKNNPQKPDTTAMYSAMTASADECRRLAKPTYAAFFEMLLTRLQMDMNLKNKERYALTALAIEGVYRNNNYKDCPEVATIYELLNDIFISIQKIDQALAFLKKGEPFAGLLATNRAQIIYNNKLSMGYLQARNLPAALVVSSKAYNMAEAAQDSTWLGITAGNYAKNLMLSRKFSEAKPYLEVDYALALRHKEYCGAAGALTLLARITSKQGNHTLALTQVEAARKLCLEQAPEYSMGEKITIYHGYADVAAAAQNYELSSKYYRRLMIDQDSFYRVIQAKQDTLVRTLYADLNKTQILTLQQQQKISLLSLCLSIFFIIGLCVLIWWLNRRQKAQQLASALLLQEKTAELHVETNHRKDLEARISVLLEKIAERNKMYESEQERIRQQVHKQEQDVIIRLTTSDKLKDDWFQDINLHTQEDWEQFKALFNDAYPDFFSQIVKDVTLSGAEMRLAALMHLGIDNKQTAELLSISQESLRKARYRLRKKMNEGQVRDAE